MILVIRHSRYTSLGTLGQVLDERGLTYTLFDSYRAEPKDLAALDPLAPDLLLVMGGTPGVYQSDIYPFLAVEKKLLSARLRADRPTLGICLGAQLMAAALGAQVYPGKAGPERGWHRVAVNEAGMNTPLKHFHPDKTMMFQWHGDTFDLPGRATLLASSDLYVNQAFSCGDHGLAVQFHPEETEDTLRDDMVSLAGLAAKGEIDIPELRQQTANYVPDLKRQTRLFFEEWLTERGILGVS